MTDQTAVDAVDPTPARRNRLRATLLAGAMLATAAIALQGAAPAFAHDELLGSSPEHGEVLAAAPASLELEFSNDVIEMGTAIIVVDAAGEALEVGEPAISGRTVTAALPSEVSDGEYQARWHVVSADGHPIEGTIDFGVGADATGVYPAPPSDEAVDPADESGSQDAATTQGAAGVWPVIGFVVGGLAMIALLAILIIRTIRRRGDAS